MNTSWEVPASSDSSLLVVQKNFVTVYSDQPMKELYREIKINKPGLRFLPELSLFGLAEVVYFDLCLYFLHA